MLLTGILAGGAVAYGTYKYNAVQSETQKALEAMRLDMYKKGELSEEDIRRLERYESTYGSSLNNILLDKVNPNSLIRSNRKSHKIFQKTRKKIEKLTEKKSPYVENETQLRVNEDGIDDFVEVDAVKPVDTYKVGKYVVSYDYLDETPNYVLSYTNSIFGHMHKGLKKEMEYLRAENAGTVSELANKEKQGKEIKKIKKPVQKDTWEYKILVESQEDIEKSRKVKNKILEGSGFWSKVGKYATKRFGDFSESGRALKRHNTMKKRVKRNIALYQQDSLKAYRELQASLADEKELLDAKSEDVVSKFDDIFFSDAKEIKGYVNADSDNLKKEARERETTSLVESKLAFDPMQINLGLADEKGKLKILDYDEHKTMSNYRSFADIYKQLVKATFDMRNGGKENYATIIALIKRYGDLMDGTRLESKLPMCHGFFRTGTMRRAMSAGIINGTDSTDGLSEETKRTLDFARVMLMQCVTQVMFDQVNNNTNLIINLEAFGKLSANYQTAKLAASALMNRVDFQETVQKETKKEAEKDRMRLQVGAEYFKKKMREDIGEQNAERYDKYIEKFLSYQAANDPNYRDIVESLKNVGANEHTENLIRKEIVKTTDISGKEITREKYVLSEKFDEESKNALQLKDSYERHLKPLLADFGDKRGLIRMYVEKFCKDKTLGLKKVEDKLVDAIEDNLGEDMLLASWWKPMVLGYQKQLGKEDNIGKNAEGLQKGRNKEVERAIKPLEGEDLLGAISLHFASAVPTEILDTTVATRCNSFKEGIISTLRKHGGNCVFDIEKLWMTDKKIAKILSDDGADAQAKFEEYMDSMVKTLDANIGVINQRMQVVANSFVFNSRRNKVFDYIGANIFSGGTALIENLTDYAINRIMTEAITDKATETLEKNVAEALDASVLEERWKISSMLALNAKLLSKGEDPANYTVDKLVTLFNEWNEEFTKRSNKIVEMYKGIFMAPAQIEKEMAFFDEHAWLEDEDFTAAVKAHVENLKKAGLLKTEKGATDVTIDEFVNAMRDRENAYKAQKTDGVKDLFDEEITNNPIYQSVFNGLMTSDDLFKRVKESVKDGDEIADFMIHLKDDQLGVLSITEYSKVKRFIESRLLPVAKYLDTLPKEQLTTTVREACMKRAMKGELEFITPENLVNEELQNEDNREVINAKRSFMNFVSSGKEMGAVDVDKSRMEGAASGKEDVLATREKNIVTAANFWKIMWKTNPEMGKSLTIALHQLNTSMQEKFAKKAKEHLIDRKAPYTREMFHNEYSSELARFVKKIASGSENVFTNSEICESWYKTLPMTEEAKAKIGTSKKQTELDAAVTPFLASVRKFVADHNINYKDLLASCNELALMGNADILMSVGAKNEDTLYKAKGAYEGDIHDIVDRMMGSVYVEDFIEGQKEKIEYDDVKVLRNVLLSSRNDETNQKRNVLFSNVQDLALALLEAVDAYEPNIATMSKMFGQDYNFLLNDHRKKFEGLRTKSAEFKDKLDKMDQMGDGAEDLLIKSYNDFFAEIEKASKTLVATYESIIKANESLKLVTKENGKITVNEMRGNKIVVKKVDPKELKFDLGNEAFILGVQEIIKDHREMLDGEETIKSLFREIHEDQEKNLHQFGSKDAYRAYYKDYAQYKALVEGVKADDEKSKSVFDSYMQSTQNYKDNCDRILTNDQKVGAKDKLGIFLPVLSQDDRFVELMTQPYKDSQKAIEEYLGQFKLKVADFLKAITKNGSDYEYDMTTVVPQFIEHHKDELLNGSQVFVTALDYMQELDFIQKAWQTRKSSGKSAQDIVNAKANRKLPITEIEKKQIIKALMKEGTVSYKKLTNPEQTAELLAEYKRRWDSNLATIKEMPTYKKLLKIKLNGSTTGETVADLLRETYADKLITMPEMDVINCLSSFAENMLEVNKTRSISVASDKDQDWDYVKEHKIKEDIKDRQVAGRNALASGNMAIRKAADSYYNGVSILSNAKTHEDKQKLITAAKLDESREKVKVKLTAIKAKKHEDVNISKEDLDILAELYSTGNVWDSFPLLWSSNIEEAFESLRSLRMKVKKIIEDDRKEKEKTGKTGLTGQLENHDVNRFILYMAAHGRLDYKGGADGFIIRTAEEFVHWFKSKFGVGAQDIKQDFVKSKLSISAMFDAYGQTQSEIDNFTAEGLNLRKSQHVIDQCNSERIALQMAMFTMDEEQYHELKEERRSLLVTSVGIADTVSETIKANKSLKQDKTAEIDGLIDVLTRGFIDYYGAEIKKLVPVRKVKNGKKIETIILTQEQINERRQSLLDDIQKKLSGEDVMYYIKAFSETEVEISEKESSKEGPIAKRTTVSVNEFEASISALGKVRAEKYAKMTDDEKKVLALIVSQPFRFLATDRVGAINMVMDHDKVTDAYFHKMYYVEENRSNAAAIDIVNLLSGKALDKKIDYMGAYERLAGRVGTKGGKEIFDQALELMELCKERIDFYKTREWDNIADPEKSIKLAGLIGKSKANTPQARDLKNAKGKDGMRVALSNMVSSSMKEKLAKVDMGILVTLLQNRSILDDSTVVGKEGMPVNALMREQVVKDLCMSESKRTEYRKNADAQMYVKNAIMTLLSFQVRDDVKLENGLLRVQDILESSLNRTTVIDEKLLSKAIDMANEISAIQEKIVNRHEDMQIGEFNEVYNSNETLSGKKNVVKYSSDLDGILFNVNAILKTQAAPVEFSVFKNKAGEKALAFRKSLADKWAAEYEKRQKEIENLSEADKAVFAEAKKAIDEMAMPINRNDSQIKTDKITA